MLSKLLYYFEIISLKVLKLTNKTYSTLKFGDFDINGFQSLLPDNPLIIELGSNDGETTKEFVRIFPKATIECYEPDQRAIAKFKQNDFPKNVTLYEKAVSNESKKIDFFESRKPNQDWSYSSTISTPKFHKLFHPEITFNFAGKIETVGINEVLRGRKVNLLWMDTQGSESSILRAVSIEDLNKIDFIYLEYNLFRSFSGSSSVRDYLKILSGFNIIALHQNDVLFAKR
jgi:FkbM family methyltransferase